MPAANPGRGKKAKQVAQSREGAAKPPPAKKAKREVDGGDFASGFSFDLGSFQEPAQAPWEFGDAIQQAKREAKTASTATTIDAKIQARLKEKERQAARRGSKQQQPSDDEDDEDDEDDGSEDEPLPGEEDDDDDDDEVDDEDDEDDAGEGSAGEDDKDLEVDGGPSASDEDEGDDEDEDDTPAPKGKQQQQQHQQQQQSKKPQKPRQAAADSDDDDEDGGGADASLQERRASGSKASKSGSKGGRGGFFAETPEGTRFEAASFGDLNLSRPLIKAVQALGYTTPTPIQAACIPLALAGRDICGSAVTGSGKTAAFALPILERLLHRPRHLAATYVLILTPTRELAVQIHSMFGKLGQFTDVRAALIVGGLSLQAQTSALRASPEVVVATPGRVLDHLRNTQSFGLDDLAVLVLDEADRLLEMGFKDEVQEIVRAAPRGRQTLLFSATFNEGVRQLVGMSLRAPVRIAADIVGAAPKSLSQEIMRFKGADSNKKEAALLALCSRSLSSQGQAIIFFRTKQRAHRAKILFGLCKLPAAAELHGDMTQAARLESLERFRTRSASFLLATDVAARGLDIQGVCTVVNFDAPKTLEVYLHRIGRTARAGAAGVSITFVEDGDRALLKEVVKRTGAQMRQRLLPPQALEQWQNKLEKLDGDVRAVYTEEAAEKQLRKAEMEANKMQNMLDHEDEIKARPARTWFQSERQKKEVKKRAWQRAMGEGEEEADEVPAEGAEDGDDDDDNGEGSQPGSAKKQSKAARRAELKAARGAGKGQQSDRKANNKLMEETEGLSRGIKGAKARLRALTQSGISASRAAKLAAMRAPGVKKPQAKKKKAGSLGSARASELFQDDKAGGKKASAPGATGAGGPGGARARSKSLSKQEANRLKRGGKGKRAFKSKARHKRR